MSLLTSAATKRGADVTSRKFHWVLGMMSGTSLDGVDLVRCAVDNHNIELNEHRYAPFPPKLRERVKAAAVGVATSHQTAQLHHDLGRFYAAIARPFRGRVDLAGLHGQTVYHQARSRFYATWQLGEPVYLADALGIPVVNNFRAGDLAAGGQGAPLATLFHERVFARRGKCICVNNLGGISNVTWLDWRKRTRPQIAAFDTGPANLLIDLAVDHFSAGKKRFDRDGAWAARGVVDDRLVSAWLTHPFIRAAPPKSSGREEFGESCLEKVLSEMQGAGLSRFDAVATLTAFTARSITKNYRLHLKAPPDTVLLGGGGAKNPVLVRFLRESLAELWPQTEVAATDDWGWPAETVEAAAFGLLAWQRMRGKPGNVPQTTGASREVLLGQVTEPGRVKKGGK